MIRRRVSAGPSPRNGDRPLSILVEEHAQGEKIGAVVDPVAADLLGRHGMGRPHEHPGRGQGTIVLLVVPPKGARQAEIEDLGMAARRHHHVLGLEIAMEQPLGMGVAEPVGNLARDIDDLHQAELAVGDELGQGTALDELHDNAITVVLLENVEDLDDRRMGQPRHGASFTAEALALLSGDLAVGAHPLDRHVALEALVPRLVDLTHPTAPDESLDAVGSETFRQISLRRIHD